MPSRPRPLVRVRRVFTYYPPYYTRRRRPRRSRPEPWPDAPAAPAVFDAGGDRSPPGLPTATLHAAAHQSRHRLLLGDFQRWLFDRWAWLRPRSIPLLVACAALPGMIAFADVIKHPVNGNRDDLRLHVRIDVSGTPDHVWVVEPPPPPLTLPYPPMPDYATETVLVGPSSPDPVDRPAGPAFEPCRPLPDGPAR